MARSVGEAAAVGLESGFRLGLDVVQQRRNNERQDRLEQQSAAERERLIQRQEESDQLTALGEQEKMHAAEAASMASLDTPPDEATQRAFAERGQALRAAKSDILKRRSGFDIEGAKQQGKVDLDKIMQAGSAADVSGEQIARAITTQTGRAHTRYLRGPQGEPSEVEQQGMSVIQGIESGDTAKALPGINFLYQPQMLKGVGEKSPHGGTIVHKEIVDLIPDPRSTPDDPRYIPTIRVYVREDGRGHGNEGRRGATGHYDAPMTKDRSSAKDAEVQSIGMAEAMDYIGQNMQIAELINQPDVVQKLQEPSGWDSSMYEQELARAGVRKPEKKVTQTVLPAGATLITTTTDKKGNISTSTTQGNPKPEPVNKQAELLQAKLDAVDEDESLTPKQKEVEKRAIRSGIKPGKYTGDGGGAGAGGGGKGGSGGTSKEEDKRVGRVLQSIKEERLALDKKKDVFLAEYKADIADGASRKDRAAAKEKYDGHIKSLDDQDSKLKARMEKLSDDLDNKGPKSLANGTKPAAKVIKALPKGAKQIGTSGGKPVYETPDGKRFKGE